ncbi:MAG: UPF0158 family protein, partial [Spirochaetaceae bacterium]|nr:UPF0158 family protein [Spirochaetaceae bacterium]
GHYVLDLQDGLVFSEDFSPEEITKKDDEFLVSLPQWTSAQGFQLMEKFALCCRDSLLRQELKSILHSGRGVFRKFKDLINHRPHWQRRWLRFKSREMEQMILHWLQEYKDYLELSHLTEEPENLDDLIKSDFTLQWDDSSKLEEIRRLDYDIWSDFYPQVPESYIELLNRRYRGNCPLIIDEKNHVISLQDLDGQLVAFLTFQQMDKELILLRSIFTLEAFRGLGLASLLLEEFTGSLDSEDVYIEISPQIDPLENFFKQRGLQKTDQGPLWMKG